ncbi:MAG: undecaprenyl-diphosphate phosphatase, partial [Coriobacteriales bacterium]
LAFDDWVHEHFYNAYVVAAMLILYGIIFIVLERRNKRRYVQYVHDSYQEGAAEVPLLEDGTPDPDAMFKIRTVDDIDWKTALKIGAFQCLAIIPGTSRSGATIIGGMLTGCSRTAAAEFTFFLAIPIMFGWGLVKTVKYMAELGAASMSGNEVMVLVVGIVTAFVTAVISIKFLMGYIKNNDFAPFGVYRIIVGIIVLGYFGSKAVFAL